MPIISYISECKAFCEYASEERLSDNEVVLWHALFNLFNQRAVSSNWPEGFLPLTNAKVLSMTPWGSGNAAVEKLRRTRDRLIQRGLIDYEPGERRKRAPLYALQYFHPVDNCSFTHKNMVNSVCNGEGNGVGNPVGNGVDIKDKDVYQDGNVDNITHINLLQEDNARADVPWYQPYVPRDGFYAGECGRELPCRFDAGWQLSDKARGAVAQRLINAFAGDINVDNLWGELCSLMERGLPPELIDDCMHSEDSASLLLAKLNMLYATLGYAEIRQRRDMDRQWAMDLKAANGDADFAMRLRRMRENAVESEAEEWP